MCQKLGGKAATVDLRRRHSRPFPHRDGRTPSWRARCNFSRRVHQSRQQRQPARALPLLVYRVELGRPLPWAFRSDASNRPASEPKLPLFSSSVQGYFGEIRKAHDGKGRTRIEDSSAANKRLRGSALSRWPTRLKRRKSVRFASNK